jgi:hypothetical protein
MLHREIQEEVGHDRVAGHRHAEDVMRMNTGIGAEQVDKVVDAVDQTTVQLRSPAFHGGKYSREHIRAEAPLGVPGFTNGNLPAIPHIMKRRNHVRGADIECETVACYSVKDNDFRNIPAKCDNGTQVEIARAKHVGKFLQKLQVQMRFFGYRRDCAERIEKPLLIGTFVIA